MGFWCEMLEYAIIGLLVIQLVRLLLADADLTLLWKEKFGTKPEILKGDVVWITGASSGIGEYLAYDLARAGCRLVLSARRESELQRVKEQCLTQGQLKDEDVFVLPLDVLHFDTHKDAVGKVLEKFKKIDVLVNNSGRSQRAWAAETELEVDRQIMDVNYFGVLSLTKEVLPHMIARKRGHIVVTSSIAGKIGSPFSAAYSGSKFALQGWFDALKTEQSINNISITMVCPGPVKSNISENSFTDKAGDSFGTNEKMAAKKMSTERCTELMAVAIANKLDEVWISENPILATTYAAQYMPSIARMIALKLGMKIIMKVRYNAGKQ